MKHSSSALSAAAIAVILGACGGGGGSSAPVANSPAPTSNAPPTISAVPSQSLPQDASSDVIEFNVSDPEATAVSVTAQSSNAALIAPEGIQLMGNDGARRLLLSPMQGAAGAATITLIATDAAGMTAQQTFDVEVTSKQRSFREMVGTAYEHDAESEGETIVGYSWVDNPEDDDTAFDHLFAQ